MSIDFNAVLIRSPRRVRFVFTNTLAIGAFTSLSTYSIASVDGSGTVPSFVFPFMVAGCPNVIELALSDDLTEGVLYRFGAAGTPCTDETTVPPGPGVTARIGPRPQPPRTTNESTADDLLAEIYGEDLVWDGRDLVEAATGDLAVQGGIENVIHSQTRRLTSDGLLWRPSYGAKPRQYVDGPYKSVGAFRGACVQQALQDDRVKQAVARLVPPTTQQPNACAIEVDELLVGGLTATAQAPVKVS